MKSSNRILACSTFLAIGLCSAPTHAAGPVSRQPAKVSGPSGFSAGAAINSLLNAVSPQMKMEVVNFLKSPDYDAVRLSQAVAASIQPQPVLAPAGVSAPQAPASDFIARLTNPQTEAERAFLVEKMRGLAMAMSPVLAEQDRLQLREASDRVQARLSPESRQKIEGKMLALTQALGKSEETAGAVPVGSAVQAGGVNENSFARRLARLLPSYPERQRAKAYLAANNAAILAIPGVAKVSVGSVLTSPYSKEPGVIITYGLGTDPKELASRLPKLPQGLETAIIPAYTPKEAATAFLRAHEARIRALPGVTEVRVGSVLTSPYTSDAGIIVRYGLGTEAQKLRASMPKSENGVEFAVIPAYSAKEAAAAYLRAHESKIRNLPGVTEVGVSSVLTSPYSAESGILVRYALGTDPAKLHARMPKSLDGVVVQAIPAYSRKEAAAAYLRAHEAEIRAFPGVAKVGPGRVVTSPYSDEPGVVVTYQPGADADKLRARMPGSVDGVVVQVIPAR